MKFSKFSIAIATLMAVSAISPALAATEVCKDPTGKTITCPVKPAPAPAKPAVATKPATTTAVKPAAAPAATKPAAAPATKPATVAAAPVAKPAAKPAARPASTGSTAKNTAIPTKPDSAAPAGATGKCKDGTYSLSKSHTGACSRHGGVANWIG